MSGTFYTEKRLQGSAHANSNSPPESENSSVELAMNAHSNRIINIQVDSSNGLKSAPVGRDKNEEEETKSHPMQRFTIVQWLQLSLIPLFIFGLLAGLGCFGVISASNSYVSNQQAMASGILSDSATAFENQIYNAFSPMLTMEMVIRANPQYDYWLRNFNSTAAYLLNQTNGQRNSASFLLNMIQVQPHGMSKLNWPDSPGLMEASCIDMLGYPDPSGAAFFLSIVAAHNGPGIMGPMVQDDPYLNITYSASAWVMWPVFITGVDITEDFGYPWSDSPAAMACVANGQCYNATTRTKWWGFVTSFIDYSMVTYGTDAKIQGLVAKGFSYRVYAPANVSEYHLLPTCQPPHLLAFPRAAFNRTYL